MAMQSIQRRMLSRTLIRKNPFLGPKRRRLSLLSLSLFDSLGLESVLLSNPQTVASIRQLPEVDAFFHRKNDDHGFREALERAEQIFENMTTHRAAVLGLLAEIHHANDDTNETLACLERIEQLWSSDDDFVLGCVGLAGAKTRWYGGHFDEPLVETDAFHASPVLRAMLFNANALMRLLQLDNSDNNNNNNNNQHEMESICELLRVIVHTLPESCSVVHRAAAYNNLGVAEIMARRFLKQLPIDAAMISWSQGLTLLEEHEDASLRGRLHLNMAWALLQEETEESLSMASQQAQQGLTLCERDGQAGLVRALGLVATCYARANAAVTAEGLFQSAITNTSEHHAPHRLVVKESLEEYAKLCYQWDKRQKDGDNLYKQSQQLNQSLPMGWRNKPAILGALWFYTPQEFL